ncbi:MAG: polyphosphate kinase 2 family protein [Anaerolineaceae bacterium]|nr:polyphosphate kinase 2 family protein [Anaerolineaceae bacterium]
MNKYRVNPGQKINLKDWDPDDKSDWKEGKKEAKDEFVEINKELESLQELLYAENKHKILIVLQAMDTGGKDGVIRAVFDGVNPAGVRVASFKVPTEQELSHDFLWRIHKQTPGKGEMVIFNRSHYEDVLVVRVHNLVSQKVWEKRYNHINNFEKLLSDEGTTILKFFLHISKDEQKERLQERLDNPEKQWKFSSGDLKERLLWEDYTNAFEDVLSKTSTSYAPWYIIPANRNWYRNWLISSILVDVLKSLKMKYPEPKEDLSKIKID